MKKFYLSFYVANMVPNLNNLNISKNLDSPTDYFTSKTSRVGRFILEEDKYSSVMMDIIKGTYQRNDWYLNVFS